MRYGLSEQQLKEITTILKKYPKVEEALIFGSRAMGNHKEGSDVDIAVKGNVSAAEAAAIRHELEEETYLPFFFDVVAYGAIGNEELKRHIDINGRPFYRAAEFAG